MLISEIQGLKYPDEYIIRFFFKENLYKRSGRVLELGCGNGNNLMLFYHYGWDAVGIDNSKPAIKAARNNFSKTQRIYKLKNKFEFLLDDMVSYVQQYSSMSFDVLLLPNSIYYLDYDRIICLFDKFKQNKIISDKSLIFVSIRSLSDYRYGRGRKLSENTYRLTIKETDEENSVVTFMSESSIVKILHNVFHFDYLYTFHKDYDNLQNGCLVSNSDIILWGKLKK